MTLNDQCLGPISKLFPELRIALSEPGTVAINQDDKKKLGVQKAGDVAQVNGELVRVVGFLEDMSSMTGCYLFCSFPTARRLLRYQDDQTTYVLARTTTDTTVREVINDLRQIPDFEVLTKTNFGQVSLVLDSGNQIGTGRRIHSRPRPPRGTAVVTSQTLYSATATMIRELAVLKVLGVPNWRMN